MYVDGKYVLSATPDEVVMWGLKVGIEVSQERIKELSEASDLQKNLERVYGFLGVRNRSRKEIVDYLKKKKVDEATSIQILEKLEKMGYINDTEFAKWWIEQRREFKPKSFRAIRMELVKKGISREIIDELNKPQDRDETKLALKLIDKKLKRWSGLPELEFKKKVYNFLGSRGFGFDVIKEVVDRLKKE